MNAQDNFIAKAKAKGYTDGQISAFLAKEQQTASVANSQPQAQPKKGTIADYLPGVFGTLGNVIGGGIGAVGAGVPTLGLGAIPGGFAGSSIGGGIGQATGEFLRQKLTGEKTDTGKIAKEGGLGLVFGGVGEGLALGAKSLAPGLGKAGVGLLKNVVNPIVDASPQGAVRETELTMKAIRNLKGNTAAGMYNELPDKFAKLTQQADDFLSKNNPKINQAKLLDAFDRQLGQSSKFRAARSQKVETVARAKLALLEDGKDARSLYALKKQLSAELKPVFKSGKKGAKLNADDQLKMAAWRAIDDALPKGLKDITRDMSDYYDLSTGLYKNKKGTGAYLGVPGINIGVSNAPVQMVSGKLGRKALELSESIPRSLGTPVGKAKLFGSVQLAGQGLRAITGGQPAQGQVSPQGIAPQAGIAQGQGASRLEAIQQQLSQLDGQATQASERVQQALAYDLMTTGGKNVSKIEALSKLTTPKAPKFSDTAIKAINESTSGLRQLKGLLADLESGNQYRTGPVYGKIQAIVPGSETQKLQAKLNLVKQTIGKAVEGGVLRKEDEAKYSRILPTVSDTLAVAQYKIAQLEDYLADDISSFIELQGNLGGGNLSGAVGNTNSTLSLLGLE